MPDYSKAKIYKIVCNITGDTYYGSTTQTLSQRMTTHRKTYKQNKCSSSEIINRGDYYYVLCQEFPCENKEQLAAAERKWIDGNSCVNKYIPGRTSKEYFAANKEHLMQKQTEYRERTKRRCICECGEDIDYHTKARHIKSEKHKNNLTINQQRDYIKK